MKEYIASLVQQTLEDYLKRTDEKQHILVLMTNQRTQQTHFWEQMKQVSERFHVTFICTKEEREQVEKLPVHAVYFIEDMKQEQVSQFSDQFELLYCPNITYDFLAKLSLLLDETIPVWITLDMMLNGREVLLGNDTIIGERKKRIWHRPSIDHKVKDYMKGLQKDGVQFCSMSQAGKTIDKQIKKRRDKRSLLLAKHVEAVAALGEKEIVVPANCIITPMAKDSAKSLQMTITLENKEKRERP